MSSSRRRRKWPWIAGVFVVLGLGGALVARGSVGPEPVDDALVIPVKRGPLAIEILETGRVEPRDRIELKSKVAGQVAEVRVDEGGRVTKGQVLLVLDKIDASRDVARAEADVLSARYALEFAQLTASRKKRGVEANVMTAVELEAADADVKARSAALKVVQVNLTAAQDRLRYTEIVSPIDGTVLSRNIEPGEVVTPGVQASFDGKPLLTVGDLATLLVQIDLNQIDVAKVRLGQTAKITLDALPGHVYEAKITKIAPASVKLAGKDVEVFPVEAEIMGVDGLIRPGMTADVRIHVEEKPGVLTLPIEAVRASREKSVVTRVFADEKGRKRTEEIEVAVASKNDREIEIVSGLSEGDSVLLDPASAAANETKL